MGSDLKILSFDLNILKFTSHLTAHLDSKSNPFAEAEEKRRDISDNYF